MGLLPVVVEAAALGQRARGPEGAAPDIPADEAAAEGRTDAVADGADGADAAGDPQAPRTRTTSARPRRRAAAGINVVAILSGTVSPSFGARRWHVRRGGQMTRWL